MWLGSISICYLLKFVDSHTVRHFVLLVTLFVMLVFSWPVPPAAGLAMDTSPIAQRPCRVGRLAWPGPRWSVARLNLEHRAGIRDTLD